MRIDGCSMRFLLQGEKEIFIKSVLQVIHTYSMMSFYCRRCYVGELEGIIAKYW